MVDEFLVESSFPSGVVVCVGGVPRLRDYVYIGVGDGPPFIPSDLPTHLLAKALYYDGLITLNQVSELVSLHPYTDLEELEARARGVLRGLLKYLRGLFFGKRGYKEYYVIPGLENTCFLQALAFKKVVYVGNPVKVVEDVKLNDVILCYPYFSFEFLKYAKYIVFGPEADLHYVSKYLPYDLSKNTILDVATGSVDEIELEWIKINPPQILRKNVKIDYLETLFGENSENVKSWLSELWESRFMSLSSFLELGLELFSKEELLTVYRKLLEYGFIERYANSVTLTVKGLEVLEYGEKSTRS